MIHCMRLSKMRKPIILQEMLDALIFPFFTIQHKETNKTNLLHHFFSSFMGLGSTCTLRRSQKRSHKPSVKRSKFTHDEQRKRQNKYTRLELKYYCWVALRQVFIFILKCIVYAAFISCGLIWHLQFRGRDRENLLMTPLGQLKFEGPVLFKG